MASLDRLCRMSCPTGNPWAILGRENPSSTDRNTAREGDIDVSRSELWRLIERDMGGRANGTMRMYWRELKQKFGGCQVE